MQATVSDLDFIEEIRMRRWARENYCTADERDEGWHPVVLDEMRVKDLDLGLADDDELVVQDDVT